MMKRLILILAAVILAAAAPAAYAQEQTSQPEAAVQAQQADSEQGMDMNEYLFGHISDAYEWHITTINGKSVAIFLPVIVHSKTTGWHCFSSRHLEDGEEYEGFAVSEETGKIIELSTGKRPFDISITKNVLSLMISSLLLAVIILLTARWYRHHDAVNETPKGFAGMMEMLITMVEDDIIKECVGKDYKRYAPYLLTAFFFIFFNNLLGIIPIFPGGANVTGNIAITMTLALCTFIAVNVFGNKHYWKDILWPDVPVYLKAFPLMPIIEIIGMFTKPFSLMVRLFANILAGHFMILGVVAVVFLTAKLGAGLNAGLRVIAVIFGIFMDVLECLVAFIQAYVFTMLSSVFIGLSRQEPETETK